MGADQSAPASTQLRSQRDEDIPYTSYSINSARSSPRLTSKSKGNIPKDYFKEALQKHDIVVVAEGSSQQETDAELKKLEEIPVFLPIIKGSLNAPHLRDSDIIDKLDNRQVLQLCIRYQDHLKQCAEAVAFDQNALCVRIKEIDFAIHSLYNTLTDRQKKFAKYAEQIQKIQEVSTVLNRVKMNVEQTMPLMERLNSVLPAADQLEPFTMKSKTELKTGF